MSRDVFDSYIRSPWYNEMGNTLSPCSLKKDEIEFRRKGIGVSLRVESLL